MNKSTIKRLRNCILAALLAGSANSFAHAPQADPLSQGAITFYYPDGSQQCSFEIYSRDIYFAEEGDSHNKCAYLQRGSTFKITNAPSTVQIQLYHQLMTDWGLRTYNRRQIKTIKEPTTITTPVAIADLRTLPAGSVVAPGVRYIGYDEYIASSNPDNIEFVRIDFQTAAIAASPKLTLEGANGANHCTLNFETAEYRFEDSDPCKNDQAVGIELEHAPSASNILLTDDDAVSGTPGCTTDNPGNYFWIMLRTIKEDVSVPPIDLDDIVATPRGSVVAPGVQVIDYYQNPPGSTPKRRTSCVKIEVDAPVPSVPLPRP
ncbi:hypothetical protein NJC38_01390 [Pseudomonas sp. 21LCFQ010]|uniref:hypothetical protein n=1 Tax=Pseudomonas sp. 21LCFQ010 TaxID=2957506 RepID=UPI002096FD35|nr:hypothetical protein [Pseudomonas sp. 21LCFQ010]MCO8160807.1 hypothetical protein [Pseudomonas sp. 21LCFQ010]